MATFRRNKLKVRLWAPQAMRRFIHEQRIRVRLNRAMRNKPPSSESGPAAENGVKPETGIIQRLLLIPGHIFPSGAQPLSAQIGTIPEPDPVPQPTAHTGSTSPTAKTNTPSAAPLSEKSAVTTLFRTLASLLPGVLLFISPFCCFTSSRQPIPIYILTALAFAVCGFYRISRSELKFIRSPLDTAVFLLPGLALLSGIGAWDKGEAVNLALLLSCCAALYWIVSSVVDSLQALHAVLAVFTASAAAAAVLCLRAVFQEGASYPFTEALGTLSAAALLITVYLRAACQRDTAACQNSRITFLNWAAAGNAAQNNTTAFQSSTASQDTSTPQANTTQNPWLNPALSAAGYLILLAITGINSPLLYLVLISGIPFSLWKLPAGYLPGGASCNAANFSLWKLRGSCPSSMSDKTPRSQSRRQSPPPSRHQPRPHTRRPATESSPGSISRNGTAPLAAPAPPKPLPTGELGKGLAHFIIYASMAFLAAGKVRLCLQSGDDIAGWVWAAIGLLLVLALEYSLAIYQKSGRRLRPWVLPGAFVLLAVLLLSGGAAYLRSTPSHDANRPARHNAYYHIEEKLLKGRDALRIVASSPRILLQGTGGGGWEPLLYRHQSFYYRDSPPGAFLQAGVEMGLPGLITLFALWILFFKAIKRTTAQRAPAPAAHGSAKAAAWPVLSAALALGCCSLWHCTLSMPAVSLVLFTLFGLGQALDSFSIRFPLSPRDPDSTAAKDFDSTMPKRPAHTHTKKLIQCLLIGCLALIAIAVSLNIYAGESSAVTASRAFAKGDTRAALINYEQAAEKNPLNSLYRKELGKLYLRNAQDENEAQGEKGAANAQSLKLAARHFQKGVRLARGDAELRVLYAGTLFQSGQPEEGVRHLETALLLRPLEQEFYEDLALGYVTAGRLLLNEPNRGGDTTRKEADQKQPIQGDPTPKAARPKATPKERKESARPYLLRAMNIPQLLEKRKAQIDKRQLRYWSGAPYLDITPKIQLYCGQAAVLLGDRKAALYYLEQAAQDASLKEEAELWLEIPPKS